MKRSLTLALLGTLLMAAKPVSAAAPSISVNEPGPYHWGDIVTLTVEVPKLKGYEYPVVLLFCDFGSGSEWTGYFRRWDDKGYGYPTLSGPEPVTLNGGPSAGPADCTFQLWAYTGLGPHTEHKLAESAVVHVDP
jgi:hypothetical protein